MGAVMAALILGSCGTTEEDTAAERRDPAASATWVLASAGSVAVPAPPRRGSAADRADEQAGADAVASRSAEATRAAKAVARTPAVQPWLEHAMDLVAGRDKDPPSASRNYALVAVAMHDATVAAYHYKKRYARPAPKADGAIGERADLSYPSEHAAIAAAGAEVLAELYDEAPAGELRQEAERIAAARVDAGAARPSDVEAGLGLGRAVAAEVLKRARADGADRKWDGRTPGGAPKFYEAPPGSAAEPVRPLAGSWKPWVLRSGRQLRSPPPPAFGTEGFKEQVRLTVKAQKDLTPTQEKAARFWAGGEGTPLPPGVWIQVVLESLKTQPLSTPETARLFALLTVAMADAGVASWDTKFAYWYPRPESGIRDSGLAPGWKPLLDTPFFPAYVSGHATYSGAASEVLAYEFPDQKELWFARAQEAADSRVWGGIHWPIDGSEGLKMGHEIGKLVVERARRDDAAR
jgi:membrane-associated phospholipid phosphatase